MLLAGKRLVVIGGAGLIGSHVVDALLREDVGEIVVFDNFCRGTHENLDEALEDPRVSIFELGGDITQTDILDAALKGADGVFHLAALWLLHCHEFPRSAFDVNVRGTFNVLEACVRNGVERLVYSSSASVYGDAVEEPMTEDHPFNNENFYGATKIAGEAMARAYHHRYGLDYVGLRYMNVYGAAPGLPRRLHRGDHEDARLDRPRRAAGRLRRRQPGLRLRLRRRLRRRQRLRHEGRRRRPLLQRRHRRAHHDQGAGRALLEITGSDVGIRYEPAGLTFVKNRIGDPERAAREIGFRATVGLEEGLGELIRWRTERGAKVDELRRAALVDL